MQEQHEVTQVVGAGQQAQGSVAGGPSFAGVTSTPSKEVERGNS